MELSYYTKWILGGIILKKSDIKSGIILYALPFANLVLPSLGNIVAPFIYWILNKHDSSYINEAGKNVLNFNLSFTLYTYISFILCFVLVGVVLLSVIFFLWLVFSTVALTKARNGEHYHYPLTIKFIK